MAYMHGIQLIEIGGIATIVAPVDSVAPIITSPLTATTRENTAWSMTLLADENVSFAKRTGADSAAFTLAGTNLSLPAQDYEGGQTALVCNLVAMDSAGNVTNFAVTVTVTDVDEIAPLITSAPTATIAASTGYAVTLTANEAVSFEKRSGADGDLFALAGTTLTLPAQSYNAGKVTFTVNLRALDGAGNATLFTHVVTIAAPVVVPSVAGIVAGARRTVVNGMNTGAYDPGGVETARVWDNSNVNCRNPRAYFHMGRTNPVGGGFVEYPLASQGTRLKYSILTDLTDRTRKDQSAATELFATFFEFAATPAFAGWGGTVSADGRELTMPVNRVVEGISWANGVVTVTVAGSAAGIAPGDVIQLDGASPAAYNRMWVVTESDGSAGKTWKFEMATNPGATVTAPASAARSWFVYSDKFVGWNAKQANGYFHKSYHAVGPFSPRFANLPAMRPDLGDLAGGDFNSNNWSTVTGLKNCLIPYILGEGDPGVKLIAVDGDSITSQNGGTWPTTIETGDADGVLCSVKRALNILGASWVDISVPGGNADVYASTFDPVATAANVRNHRHSILVPMADVVLSRMLHNDRRSYSVPFDVALRRRYEGNNLFLRSKMKAGARLGRVTLFASSNPMKMSAVSQSGTTVTVTLPTTAGLAVGTQVHVTTGNGATASLSSNLLASAVSQSGNTITVTVPSTVGMTAGDLLLYSPNRTYGVYNWPRDGNGLVPVASVLSATQFTVTSTSTLNRSDTATDTFGAPRRITAILSATQVTYEHPAGLNGDGSLGSGGIDFNSRWTSVEQQVPPNDDSDFSDMTNLNKGGVKRLNNLIMRRGDYAAIPYGGANEIDFGVDNVASVQTEDGKWRADGTPYFRPQDATHPNSKAHAAEAPGLATQLAARL